MRTFIGAITFEIMSTVMAKLGEMNMTDVLLSKMKGSFPQLSIRHLNLKMQF